MSFRRFPATKNSPDKCGRMSIHLLIHISGTAWFRSDMRYVLLLYALVSVATLVLYWLDKRAAIHRRWRIPEATLHLLEALGGFPGALIGQRMFRHKRRKLGYMIVFWLIVIAHAIGWTLWIRFR